MGKEPLCSQIHAKHINILFGQKLEILYVKRGGTYSNHWTLKSQIETSTFKQPDLLGFYSASLEVGATLLRNV
jgi:hypothetical protein